uniref:non-specific serine/threonine protein kinase n=1 Tax=Ananas comosus var. bracteatus TaxID=296719 RepID=A0A6V7QHW2_ANACO|nr:unnamed protein product [Ananas comosus var. bracteatus]
MDSSSLVGSRVYSTWFDRSLNSRQICYCAVGNIPLLGPQVVERKEINGRHREVPTKPEALVPRRYAYTDLIAITSHFREKLGQGGFGSVSKGVLPGGVLVAVKMLLSNSRCNGEEFINEVSTIGRIHHVNMIKLVGFCSEGTKRALVYEYMPNGSLDKHIFCTNGVAGWRTFTWDKLNDIALGIARGINYLHQGCDKRILHFDIKQQNILLDRNFTPKVADFGLAKLYPKDTSLVSMSTTRGTTGYIAPELISRSFGIISHKSDVYSFGMLLMEMAGGRRNADPRAENSSQAYYPSWIYDRLTQPEISEISTTFDISEGSESCALLDCGVFRSLVWGNTLGGAFPKIYQASNHNNLKVSDVFSSDGWNWNRIFGNDPAILTGGNDEIAKLKDRISHLTILQNPDQIYWRWSPNGLFSVKSTYLALTDGGTRDLSLNMIWNLRIPLKVKVFCRLALKKRLPTTDLLVKRRWVGNVVCVLCGAEEESVDYLFTRCVFTKFIIVAGVNDIQASDLGSDVNRVWALWRVRTGGHMRRSCLSELVGCWWSVWKARNDTIFRSIQPNPSHIVHMFKQLLKEWDSLTPTRRTSV